MQALSRATPTSQFTIMQACALSLSVDDHSISAISLGFQSSPTQIQFEEIRYSKCSVEG